MIDAGGVPPPPPPLAPPPPPPPPLVAAAVAAPPRRRRRVLLISLIALVIAAGTVGGVFGFRLLGGSADGLVSLAPSDSLVYVNAHLDPSAGQKLALNGLLDKFPALSGSSRDDTINKWLDTALQQLGLSHADVRSWLGNDISVIVPASAFTQSSTDTSPAPSVAALLSSTNDSAAQAAIDKLRESSGSESSSTAMYRGVTVTTVTRDGQPAGFAVAGHALIIGTTAQAVDEVIDTAQGRHAALQSNAVYTKAVGQVPSDRIGLAYIDVGALAQQVSAAAGRSSGLPLPAGLQGYQGVALALVAHGNGVSVTGVEDFDAAKMSADQRAQLGAAPHVNGSLSFMPRSAYVAGAISGIKQNIQSALDAFGSAGGFNVSSVLQQLGLTGPGGLIDHLNGDAGIDLAPGSQPGTPEGAIAVGTDSDSVAQSVVTKLMNLVCDCAAGDPAQVDQEPYDGTVISSLPASPDGSSGIQPSWAVFHGWIIAGTSPGQVKAALDADRNGTTLAANPDYTAVMSQVGGTNNGELFIDVQPLLSVIRGALPPAVQLQYDHDVAPNLKPLKAFGMAVHNAADHVTINAFTLIP